MDDQQIQQIALELSQGVKPLGYWVWFYAESELRLRSAYKDGMLEGTSVMINVDKIAIQPWRDDIRRLAEKIATQGLSQQQLQLLIAERQFIYQKVIEMSHGAIIPANLFVPTSFDKRDAGTVEILDKIAQDSLKRTTPVQPSEIPPMKGGSQKMTRKNDADLLQKFKAVLAVSQRVKKAEVAKYLGISDEALFAKLVEWREFGFKVDGDLIVVEDLKAFITALDKQFTSWTRAERSNEGKVKKLKKSP